ncbi:MAG: Mu-like prophage major head subunit gpT family protein [Alphaproteobacteria bacterium]
MTLPRTGIWGEVALREAAAGSYQEIMRRVEAKLRELLKLTGEQNAWAYVVALFPDQVVVNQADKLVRYDWREDGAGIVLANPTEVMETFRPVARTELREAGVGPFVEAANAGEGGRWLIRVIRAGLSGNRNYYPDAVLREAAPLFDGCRVFVKPDKVHLEGGGRDFRNLIGRLVEPRFVEGKAPDSGELQATLELLEAAGDVAGRFREAVERGMADLFGFSIDVVGTARAGKIGGQAVRVAGAFREVRSVDLIVQPGAGGQVIRLIEALNDEDTDMKLRDRMRTFIEAKRPDLAKGLDWEDDEAIEAAYREAAAGDGDPAGLSRDEATALVRQTEARAHLREALADSKLPAPAKERIRADFAKRERFTEAEVDTAIEDEGKYLARFAEGGRVALDFPRIEPGEDRAEKVQKMLDAFFDPADRSVVSFKECYAAITGDHRVTGRSRDCDEALMRESLASGTFDQVLGDAVHRRLVADYRTPAVYDVWRRIVNVVPITDFRTNHRTRYGGYGDLPAVAEGAPYLALTSPTDEEATYAISKKGGTEDITLEMVRNDDVGVIRQIPVKLSRASRRTLAKFVLDFVRTNPVIYDSVDFFHADHGNLGSAALDGTSLAAARLRMLKLTEKDSGDRLGIGPKSLLVPSDLEETAVNLFRRSTENDKTFIGSLALDVLPVWYWTDANDWALAADPMDIPGIEIGFLDGNEEPELFVQDNPTSGSLFSHDKLTYKIRHIFGGAVTDYRAFQKNVVT